jgi:hypothetical protein
MPRAPLYATAAYVKISTIPFLAMLPHVTPRGFASVAKTHGGISEAPNGLKLNLVTGASLLFASVIAGML